MCEVGHKIERVPSRPDILSVGEILTATLRYNMNISFTKENYKQFTWFTLNWCSYQKI